MVEDEDEEGGGEEGHLEVHSFGKTNIPPLHTVPGGTSCAGWKVDPDIL